MVIQLDWKEKANGTLAQALAREAGYAPNCFRFNGTGGMVEGIQMFLDHPSLPGKPAVFVGEWGVVRNYRNGCLYVSNGDGTAIVRRAMVELVRVGEGKPFPTLAKPESSTDEALVHVSVSLASNVSVKENFWAGVLAGKDAKLLASCFETKEVLVQFLKNGASATVFYEDGSVKGLLWEDFQLKVIGLSLEDQAKARISQAEGLLEEAKQVEGDAKIRKQDFALHLLCGVLAVGGARSKEVFGLAFERILDAADDGLVRPGVKTHAERAVCQAMAAADPDEMERNLQIFRGSVESSGGEQDAAGSTGRKTGRAATEERRKRKAERAVRDRAFQQACKGPSGGGGAKKAGSGKKSKKNKK